GIALHKSIKIDSTILSTPHSLPGRGPLERLHSRQKRSEQTRAGVRRRNLSGHPLAGRRRLWRKNQLRVVDDVADIFVVADEADPAVRPFQPHQVTRLHRLRILVDRDHLAAIEPGGGEKMSKQVVRGGDVAELLE